ncbi:6-pyruvoyl-tetrahydropterin synthase-related protein [Patescibacteria group bacterium]|nr:6-pyruvoyl-tetrahydropterin synthase-related protein [Patescibacteria group bacterium]
MKKIHILLILILITLPTILPFFNSRFFYTQDYIFIARLQQMSTALQSGQFPVRWAPDLRYGEPLFNFYAPLPYYIGALINVFGFNVIWTAKIMFMLASMLSAVAMYILANKLFGQKAGILAAVLYTYAPYRAVDIYVRGSLSETVIKTVPKTFYHFSLMLVKGSKLKNLSFLSLSLAGLFLTHNVTTLMFLPFLIFWWIYLVVKEKSGKVLPYFVLASILGAGLAAFFLLPAVFEKDFIQTKYLIVGYFNFRAHFVAFKQFFSLFWGYGSSVWGLDDGLSFQVGLMNFVILAIAAVLAILKRNDKKFLGLFLLLAISFIFSLFLQHNKSAFIWETIPLMAFIQFPWRFLGISIFIVSLVGGAIAPYLKNRLSPLFFVLIIVAVLSTVMYFRPKEYASDSFFDKFLNTSSMHNGFDLTKDYLPIWVQTTDDDRFDAPRTEIGKMEISGVKQKSTELQFSTNVSDNALIEAPITYFPGWEVYANDQIIRQTVPSEMGLIRFKLPKGSYKVKIELKDTPVRVAGNIISAISVLLIMLIFFYPKQKSPFLVNKK